MDDENKLTTVKIRESARRKLKVIAAKQNVTMADLITRLVEEEYQRVEKKK